MSEIAAPPNAESAPPRSFIARLKDSDLLASFLSSKVTVAAGVITVVLFLAALFAPWIAPTDPFNPATNFLSDSLDPPSFVAGGDPRFWLGTDDQGRDIWSAILYGLRVSLAIGFCGVLLGGAIGIGLGLISGYAGGWTDSVIMRIADVQLTFPAILIALLLDGVAHALLKSSSRDESAFGVLVVAIGLSFWVQYARTVRASTMVEKSRDYVLAARLIGLSHARILFSPYPAQRDGSGAGDRHDQPRSGHHHRGYAVLPRRRPAADPAVARHVDSDRPELSFFGRMVDRGVSEPHAGGSRAGGESARRLAARCAQSKAEMTGALLSVRDLEVEFATRNGPLVALDRVSFEIAPGEVLGVVGESGAGKSLTGLAIIGLLDPPGRIAGGEIRLDGARIDNLPPARMREIRGRRIGIIFQDPLTSLNPLLRIGDQLSETILAHTSLTRRQARERAIAWLGEVGIPSPEKRIDGYPHEFSGGMRQRVVIALALCAEPALVIADEPTTALDVSVQAQIIAVLKNLTRRHGAAVMLITHDMGVIAETADRVAVMYAGRIVEIGEVGQVVRKPLHPYAQGLMAAIPTLEARVDRLAQIPGAMPRLSAIPRGCAFAPRCPNAFGRCVERPPLLTVGARRAACWLYEEKQEPVLAEVPR